MTFAADLVAEVESRVGAGEFADYVTEALERKIEREKLAELVQETRELHGPVPEGVAEEVEALWDEAFGEE